MLMESWAMPFAGSGLVVVEVLLESIVSVRYTQYWIMGRKIVENSTIPPPLGRRLRAFGG